MCHFPEGSATLTSARVFLSFDGLEVNLYFTVKEGNSVRPADVEGSSERVVRAGHGKDMIAGRRGRVLDNLPCCQGTFPIRRIYFPHGSKFPNRNIVEIP